MNFPKEREESERELTFAVTAESNTLRGDGGERKISCLL